MSTANHCKEIPSKILQKAAKKTDFPFTLFLTRSLCSAFIRRMHSVESRERERRLCGVLKAHVFFIHYKVSER